MTRPTEEQKIESKKVAGKLLVGWGLWAHLETHIMEVLVEEQISVTEAGENILHKFN